MKSIKIIMITAALAVSSLALAEGGGDRTFARMEAARTSSMESYQVAQKNSVAPPVGHAHDKANGHAQC